MRILATCLVLFITLSVNAQNISAIERLQEMRSMDRMDYRNQNIQLDDFFKTQKSSLGFENDVFKIKSEYSHKSEKKIIRYTQYHKGLEIIGGSLILHADKQTVLKSVGQIVPHLDINTSPNFLGSQVVSMATEGIQHILVKDNILNVDEQIDWKSTHSHLVIMDRAYPNKSGDYRLAYQSDVHGANRHYDIFIDAHTGEILAYINRIHSTPIEGTVETNYYGNQQVTIAQIDNNHYELHDETRGNGIFTYDAVTNQVVSNSENEWNSSNPNYSKAAGDVHYGTTAYYDFMLDRFGWSGLDGNDAALISNVNVNGKFYANAFWNGSTTNYGNGNCERFNPLTSIDIVGHEWTHGFVDYSSDLIYYDQSGALNEASADIFGKALEHAYDPTNFSWNVGQHMLKDQNGVPIEEWLTRCL